MDVLWLMWIHNVEFPHVHIYTFDSVDDVDSMWMLCGAYVDDVDSMWMLCGAYVDDVDSMWMFCGSTCGSTMWSFHTSTSTHSTNVDDVV